MMKIKFDQEADALYIEFSDKSVNETQGDWPFNVDLDEDGNVVGIEIMDAKSMISSEYIDSLKSRATDALQGK